MEYAVCACGVLLVNIYVDMLSNSVKSKLRSRLENWLLKMTYLGPPLIHSKSHFSQNKAFSVLLYAEKYLYEKDKEDEPQKELEDVPEDIQNYIIRVDLTSSSDAFSDVMTTSSIHINRDDAPDDLQYFILSGNTLIPSSKERATYCGKSADIIYNYILYKRVNL